MTSLSAQFKERVSHFNQGSASALSPLLIWTGGSTPLLCLEGVPDLPDKAGESTLLCLEGVPDLPVAPQDEAGLTKTFQTWPRGWFHIP